MSNIQWGSSTDIGFKRKRNEDCIFLLDPNQIRDEYKKFGVMFAVADGMGGQTGGEIASNRVCESLINYYQIKPTKIMGRLTVEKLRQHLVDVIFDIDLKVFKDPNIKKSLIHMGTTLSVLVLIDSSAVIAHVGDSRVYRIQNNQIKQLTVDHTFVQEMIDEGELRPDKVSKHPLRHMLTHVVGTQEALEKIFSRTEHIWPGDSFILCTDGLHNLVPDHEILKCVSRNSTPQEKADRLVKLALEKGGEDNISVIVVQV